MRSRLPSSFICSDRKPDRGAAPSESRISNRDFRLVHGTGDAREQPVPAFAITAFPAIRPRQPPGFPTRSNRPSSRQKVLRLALEDCRWAGGTGSIIVGGWPGLTLASAGGLG